MIRQQTYQGATGKAMASGSTESYDAIVVGAGHNGLVCAAYLARNGLSVKVIERRPVIGGAAVTEEFHPGFRNSVCAYSVSLLHPKIITDLDLARRGLEIVERSISNLAPTADGGYLCLYPEAERTAAEIARHSQRDGEAYPAYAAQLDRLAGVLRALALETPPNVDGGWGDVWRAWLTRGHFSGLDAAQIQELADLFTLSAAEYLGRWFESDAVKALFAFDAIVGTFASPFDAGTAYVLLHHCFGEVNGRRGAWGHAIGGMGAISAAIADAAQSAGAEIECDAPVARILCHNGAANGVELEDGRRLAARIVAVNAHPKLLYENLLPDEVTAPQVRRRIAQGHNHSASFRINVALSELPDFTCLPGRDLADHHKSGIVIAPGLDYMDAAYRDARANGYSKRAIVEMLIPSTVDPGLAPPGQHVASLFCQHFRYDLPDGGSWDDERERAADVIIDTVNDFAPNFRDAVIARSPLSPLDLERDFGLVGGDIFHGALRLNQLFSFRPAAGLAGYRLDLKGLYLCGAGAHPGGGVSGLPGHNAAREILADRGWLRWRR